MQTAPITLDRQRARDLWRDYRKHQHWSKPIDHDVMTAYQAIAQGKMVIKALESVRAAGLGEDNLPNLAIVRADAEFCWLSVYRDITVFASTERAAFREALTRQRIEFPRGSFPGIAVNRWRPRAMVPQIPLPLRPKRGLANYHLLFEAEWSLVPPTDPMLLRRVGPGDLWIVCAAWDLTEIERTALAARVRA